MTTLEAFLKKKGSVLQYNDCLLLFTYLSNQMVALEKNNQMIPFFSLKNIVNIDDNWTFINNEKIFNIDDDTISPDKNDFTVPEKLITHKSGWYSLASIIAFCLTNKREHTSSEILSTLKPIYATKLYWALERLLKDDPNERVLLMI